MMDSSVAPRRPALWRQVLSDEKVVSSPLLNRLGVQLVRSALAHGLYRVRPRPVPDEVRREVDALRRDGVVVLPGFLPEDQFEALRTEFFDVVEHHIDDFMTLDDANVYQMGYVHELGEQLIPKTCQFLREPRLRALLEGAEKRTWGAFFRLAGLECITYGDSVTTDPQVALHSDSFHHTHKAWLYMDDVTRENGPLAVIKGSHHLRLGQLRHIYAHSNKSGHDPSRRIPREELEHLGLEETVVVCASNTLVIANTHAYHHRTQGRTGAKRYAIHLMARARPFRS